MVWIIFTGNDLRNLAEERQTKLSLYLNDENHHQDYFHNLIRKKELISAMKSFHNSIYAMPNINTVGHGYGETVTPGSISEQTALRDFSKIVYQFNELVESRGGTLNVVVLENHPLPKYNSRVQQNTQQMLLEECSRLKINCLRFDLSDETNKISARGHLNEAEYYKLSVEISRFISSPKRYNKRP